MLRSIALWLENRLHLVKIFEATAGHKVPPSTNSWFYVFGSGTLLCFVLQIITGICLALVYVPSASQAWPSLQYLNNEQFLGAFLRAVHNWGSIFMVAIMSLHLVQTFLFGAYKYPRELTWVSGCVLFLCTLGMAFTGQVLRFDQDAYWGLGIGASIMGRVPFVGAQLVHFMLAGSTIAGETLSRFFTMHVFVVPGMIIALLSLHLRLVLTKGINEYPQPGRLVSKETYENDYEEEVKKTGVPFVPDVIGKDLIFSAFLVVAIVTCALVFGPAGPNGPPNPTLIHTAPKPDFYFLPVYAILALLPAYMETFLLLVAPVIGFAILILLPFYSGTGEKSYRRRPMAILIVVLAFLTVGLLAHLGTFAPWSPHMDAWSGAPTPVAFIKDRSGLELQGALLIQGKQCRNCHSLNGEGGQRGPALDTVATRLTRDELVRQVIQGSGNMPAYGKNLSPAEVSALVAFMETLRPSYQPPAHDATESVRLPSNESAQSTSKDLQSVR
jgi:ubiquinol-cytochrome c reductase cytochrome b subunit